MEELLSSSSSSDADADAASSITPDKEGGWRRRKRLRTEETASPLVNAANTTTTATTTMAAVATAVTAATTTTAATGGNVAVMAKPNRKMIGYDFVYENPFDMLVDPPTKVLKPRFRGDTVGDALFFGDGIGYGVDHMNSFLRYPLPWPELLRPALEEKGFRLVSNCLPGRTTILDDERFAKRCALDPHDFNGLEHLGAVFSSHSPMWIVFILGQNDLKSYIRKKANEKKEDDDDNTNNDSVDIEDQEDDNDPKKYRGDQDDSNEATVPLSEEELKAEATKIADRCAILGLKARELFTGHCHEGNLRIMFVTPPKIRLTRHARALGFDSISEEVSALLPGVYREMCIKHGFLNVHSSKFDENIQECSFDGVHITQDGGDELAHIVWEEMLKDMLTIEQTTKARAAAASLQATTDYRAGSN